MNFDPARASYSCGSGMVFRVAISVGVLRPHPGRKEHIGAERFHVPRRNVDRGAG